MVRGDLLTRRPAGGLVDVVVAVVVDVVVADLGGVGEGVLVAVVAVAVGHAVAVAVLVDVAEEVALVVVVDLLAGHVLAVVVVVQAVTDLGRAGVAEPVEWTPVRLIRVAVDEPVLVHVGLVPGQLTVAVVVLTVAQLGRAGVGVAIPVVAVSFAHRDAVVVPVVVEQTAVRDQVVQIQTLGQAVGIEVADDCDDLLLDAQRHDLRDGLEVLGDPAGQDQGHQHHDRHQSEACQDQDDSGDPADPTWEFGGIALHLVPLFPSSFRWPAAPAADSR